jgi:hypothetical protein
MLKGLLGGLLLTLLLQVPLPTTPPLQDEYQRSPRLGVTFINSADHPITDQRYKQALFLGAGWNRWPLYWDRVETSPGGFNWGAYDALVSGDLSNGLQSNAILMGRPAFFQEGGSITGLNSPVFGDGTDSPAPGKFINPDNKWAVFVHEAVSRYKPGGYLAQMIGWPAGQGVTVWEAWNEPDFPLFWVGSVGDYARLLKVTYLAAHHADPNARVMFGGLAYTNPYVNDWLARVLAIYAEDPDREANNWYMDMVAVHSYTYARRSGEMVRRVRENLARYNLTRPVWLNENGVPVWDDYPGPTWAGDQPESRQLRATAQQQAAYVIQSAAFAWAEGAEVVMYHQLYDDCGNQRAGTDFPPNNGDICSASTACWGDAHGLFRNPSDAPCFRQHPLPGSPRPAALAYRILGQIFGRGAFSSASVQMDSRGIVIAFERGNQRIYVAWNRTFQATSVELPAQEMNAQLFTIVGDAMPLEPVDGVYRLNLPAATPDDFPHLHAGDVSGIGGAPFILVEGKIVQTATPAPFNPALVPMIVPQQPIATMPYVAPEQRPTVRPTIDPARDQTPPSASINSLPVVSPASFTVSWSGQDDSGIASYLVWVRIDAGEWQPWLETTETQAEYTGSAGSIYEFAVWALDLAGNWSMNTEITPQAVTAVR